MNLRYRCLVLDHDDTTVDSTAHIHYPAFVECMAKMRPDIHMTLEEYFEMNCEPGIFSYLTDVAKLNEEELRQEKADWIEYARTHSPTAYPWIPELLRRQKELGGYICVVSHNLKANILRDYEANALPAPDLIFGSELPPEQMKPAPWPLLEIMRRLSLAPSELLVVDDLIMGHQMAAAAGVDFAGAVWAHQAPQVRDYLAAHRVRCLSSPRELYELLFPLPA